MDFSTSIENEKAESLILAQRRTWRRIFWWIILPGLMPPLSFIIIKIPMFVSEELSSPRPAYSRSFPLEFSIIVFVVAVWNATPYIALALLGKDWLGMKTPKPIAPATFYEQKVAFIAAALPATAIGILIDCLIVFSRRGDPLGFLFVPILIFIIAGLGLFSGWVIGRGSQTYQ
jgi:hypothetical protein